MTGCLTLLGVDWFEFANFVIEVILYLRIDLEKLNQADDLVARKHIVYSDLGNDESEVVLARFGSS